MANARFNFVSHLEIIEDFFASPETSQDGVFTHHGLRFSQRGKVAVAAPSLIRGLGEDWSVRGAVPGEDVVALRFRLPSNLPSH